MSNLPSLCLYWVDFAVDAGKHLCRSSSSSLRVVAVVGSSVDCDEPPMSYCRGLL